MTFENQKIDQILRDRFGLKEFRPGQREAIETLLEHRRLICIQPTGHGKSLLYQLPSVLFPGLTVVISPLLALMRDQIGQLGSRFNIASGSINSDQSEEENNRVITDALSQKLRILFVAPEQLDNLKSYEFLSSLTVDLIVVDEAHCISTWGHDFRPSYRKIIEAAHDLERRNPGVRVLGLTATANSRTETDIVEQFRGPDGALPRIHRAPMDRPNIVLSTHTVRGLGQKLGFLTSLLRDRDGCGILYCATREQTEIVADFLTSHGVEVAAYHAGLPPEEKRLLQQGFIDGTPRVVAATNALGMGIDKPDIRFVVHVDVPGSITAYYQEVGRAGRDGMPAAGILLFDPDDRKVQDHFIRSAQPTREDFEGVLASLDRPEAETGPIKREVAIATGMHPTKVTVVLAELQEQGFCEKRLCGKRQVYEKTPRSGLPDLSRYERQLQVRSNELAAILRYGEGAVDCLMQALRVALGDSDAPACGRCSRCAASENVSPTAEAWKEAQDWIVGREIAIASTRAPKMSAGLTLLDGESRSPLFARFMRGRASEASIEAELLKLLEKRVQTLASRHCFGGVVVIPSRTWSQREFVARQIAEQLDASLHLNTLVWGEQPEQMQSELRNNDQRRENVAGRMTSHETELPGESILLVDDYHGSSHTLKEAVRVLRKELGVTGEIVPLTVARVRWRLGSRGMI